MKNTIYLAVGFTWILNACSPCIKGSNNIISLDKPASEFHGVNANGSYEIIITQGENYNVKVSADDNILPFITTEVRAGILFVESKSHQCLKNVYVKVYLTAPRIDNIALNGSGNIYSTNTLDNDAFTIDLSGSGNINIVNNSHSAKVNLKGSGILKLSGTCETETVVLSGSGNIEADNFTANDVTTTLSGSGNMEVFAKSTFKATLSGSGRIQYSGNPTTDIKVTGSGKVLQHQ